MDLLRIIKELIDEKRKIEIAIAALEDLQKDGDAERPDDSGPVICLPPADD